MSMSGAQHYDAAERILDNIGGEQDAYWSMALATRALAHATLAGAARDYGRHIEIAVPPVSMPAVRSQGNFPDELTLRREHLAELRDMLADEEGEFHVQRD